MFHSGPQKLLKYFKRIELSKEERIQSTSVLPKPNGPLARLMPSSAIEAANSAVRVDR